MNYLKYLFIFMIILFSYNTQAKVIYIGNEAITINLSYDGPKSESTVFRFPSEVKTISQAAKFEIFPADPRRPDYAVLSVRPRVPSGEQDVAFILTNGQIIKIHFVIVSINSNPTPEAIYDFKVRKGSTTSSNDASSIDMPDLELMKAMIKSESLAGYQIEEREEILNKDSQGMETQLKSIYSGSDYTGYIFKLINHSSKLIYDLDVRSINLEVPNKALLSHVEKNILGPKSKNESSTLLHVVTKTKIDFKNLNLPFNVKETK